MKKKRVTIPPKPRRARPSGPQRTTIDFPEAAADEAMLRATRRLSKKRRPLLKSYAGVAPSLSSALPKKKTAARPDPDALNMTEYAEDLRQKLVAEERECEFWIDEAERFRNQVVELLRERAATQAGRGGGT